MLNEQDDLLIRLLIQMEQRAVGAAPSRELINFISRHQGLINKLGQASPLPAQSLLHRAAFLGNKLVSAWLLIKGADINVVDEDGKTPLDYAISKSEQDLISYFKNKGGASANDRYIDNKDGTITDTSTKLTWMRCALGQTWDGANCTGEANTYNLGQALALNMTFAGYSNWRLPDIQELRSIMGLNQTDPLIDENAFPNTPSNGYWSSTEDRLPNTAWFVASANGASGVSNGRVELCIRLLRDKCSSEPEEGQKATVGIDADPANLAKEQTYYFNDNGNGTVTDTRTGLTWMRCALGQIWDGTTCTGEAGVYGWKFAKCIKQSYAGYEDWRLPTKYEIKGIVDSTRKDPSIDIEYFPGTPSGYSWSGTITPRSDQAWGVDFSHGGSATGLHGIGNYVRFVRDRNLTKSVSVADEILTPLEKAMDSHLDNGDGTVNDKVPGSQIMNEGHKAYARDNNQPDEADACFLQTLSGHNKATDNTTEHEIGYYIDNSDGTVTDTRTGLMWMRCALGQTWDGTTCTGEVSRHRLDHALNPSMTFSTYSDWRLPTIEELESLTDLTHTNPTIDIHAFPSTPSSYPNKWFWSSSPNIEAPTYALRISFGNGEVFSFASRTECWSVRLVRACTKRADHIDNRIVYPDEGIIIDQSKEALTTNKVDQHCTDPYFAKIMKRIDIMESLLISSIARIEKEARRASSKQLAATDRIEIAIKELLVNQLTETLQSMSGANKLIDNITANRATIGVVSIATLLTQLIELKTVSQAELRALLLPIGMMPNAVINDINERALDLTGESALVEEGDTVIVQREVLLQVMANQV